MFIIRYFLISIFFTGYNLLYLIILWMIANEDENWAVSFREEEEREGEFIVKIHKIDTNKTKFDVKETFESDEEIRRRIENVLGATNYSVLLRNSEHIAWYIFTNIWASFQVGQEISNQLG